MRVIAGSARGRPLRAPVGHLTRPTSDRVRESMFDILGSLDVVEGARVVDLFAGSGALGIEARSRGAAEVTFVDRDPAAVQAIGDNLASLGWAGGPFKVVRADALHWLSGMGAADVVLADPPYAYGGWAELMSAVADTGFDGLMVIEAGAALDPLPGWEVLKVRRYGSTVVQLVQPAVRAGLRADQKGGR